MDYYIYLLYYGDVMVEPKGNLMEMQQRYLLLVLLSLFVTIPAAFKRIMLLFIAFAPALRPNPVPLL